MSANSNIEWTEATWNCLAGCEAVSPGCKLCYAATMTRRLESMGQKDYAGLTTDKHFNGVVRCLPHKLDIPLKRRKPTTYFVNSMSDLFHEDVPDEFIEDVFVTMLRAPRHTFQVLTKRAERMASVVASIYKRWKASDLAAEDHATYFGYQSQKEKSYPLANVWLGVSCEDQKRADERIPWLLKTPAAVRFLSCEPLIGPINLSPHIDPASNEFVNSQGINCDWVIVGGESGPGSRPCRAEWILSIIEQCKAAGVPCFVKQLGANPEGYTNEVIAGLQDRKGGNIDEWPQMLRVRQMPGVANG